MKVKSLGRVRLFATPWTAAYQAPPSMGFSSQEYWEWGAIAFSGDAYRHRQMSAHLFKQGEPSQTLAGVRHRWGTKCHWHHLGSTCSTPGPTSLSSNIRAKQFSSHYLQRKWLEQYPSSRDNPVLQKVSSAFGLLTQFLFHLSCLMRDIPLY